jgi:hypothetical protein
MVLRRVSRDPCGRRQRHRRVAEQPAADGVLDQPPGLLGVALQAAEGIVQRRRVAVREGPVETQAEEGRVGEGHREVAAQGREGDGSDTRHGTSSGRVRSRCGFGAISLKFYRSADRPQSRRRLAGGTRLRFKQGCAVVAAGEA